MEYFNRVGKVAVPVQEFARYIREHFLQGFAAAVLILLVYGKQAFSTDFYVDAEVVLNNPRTVYNWDRIGRFGLIALKFLTGNIWYNPYFEAVLFLAALWLAGMFLAYLFSMFAPETNGYAGFIFIALFLAFPTHVEQFIFRFQSFEVAFAMLLVLAATRYFYAHVLAGDRFAYGVSVFFNVFSYGIYQSMANLQICCHIAVYLFLVSKSAKVDRVRLAKAQIVHFLTGFALYEFIAQVFFGGSDYLGGQVGWLSGSPGTAARNLLAYIKHVLLASDVFYPVTYLGCVCFGAAFLCYVMARDRQKMLPYTAGIGSLLASPFFLALITGTPPPYRAQCMLAFVCAVMWLFAASWLGSRHVAGYAACVLCGCVFLLCQTSAVMRLFYTQDVIREADRVTAVRIMERVEECISRGGDKPVVFVGHLDAKTNGSCYGRAQASYMSYSVYEFAYIEGVPVPTPDYFNTGRILGYFGTLGFDYEMPSVEVAEAAGPMASGMEPWPRDGSVRETESCIIVKLGESPAD